MNIFLLVSGPLLLTLLAVVGDIVSYQSFAQRKGYSPNLALWGVGFLFGLSVSFVYLMGFAADKLLDNAFLDRPYLLLRLLLFVMPAALLGLVVWAVSRICDTR